MANNSKINPGGGPRSSPASGPVDEPRAQPPPLKASMGEVPLDRVLDTLVGRWRAACEQKYGVGLCPNDWTVAKVTEFLETHESASLNGTAALLGVEVAVLKAYLDGHPWKVAEQPRVVERIIERIVEVERRVEVPVERIVEVAAEGDVEARQLKEQLEALAEEKGISVEALLIEMKRPRDEFVVDGDEVRALRRATAPAQTTKEKAVSRFELS